MAIPGDYPTGVYIVRGIVDKEGGCGATVTFKLIISRCLPGEPEPWVRTMPMTCWHVWINKDNNFQFIFWYPYKNENIVRIYDLEDNLVFETDLPGHDPNLIVDLPDGFYWVRTYHDQELLQEFLIGKP